MQMNIKKNIYIYFLSIYSHTCFLAIKFIHIYSRVNNEKDRVRERRRHGRFRTVERIKVYRNQGKNSAKKKEIIV
jgi:hypothetical protein